MAHSVHINAHGIRYYVEITGAGHPLVLLHGFTGSGRSWDAASLGLSDAHTLIAVDLIGHGQTDAPADAVRYSMERSVGDLCAVLDRLSIERSAVLGYSMGGRLALHLALAAPERVTSLILESASPGIEDGAERMERRRSDERLARRIERQGVEAFVRHWESLPLFAGLQRVSDGARARLHAERLAHPGHGLANSLRGMGAGTQASLWARLSELSIRVLLIAGAEDQKYCSIAVAMHRLLPNAELAIIPDAGHVVHLEQPEAFARQVREFLR